MSFRTFSNSKPLVISGTVSNITKNSATGSGKIMDNGGSAIKKKGVQIWTGSPTPPAPSSDNLRPSSGDTEFFTVDTSGLIPNTIYYARAYATNVVSPSSETDYTFGATVDFTTLKNTPDMGSGPLTVTTDINSVGQIVVTASYKMPDGTIFGTDPGEVQGYGFVWSTDDDPELYADHTIAGVLSSGTFTAQYVGAREGIAAYVRAYATYEESAVTSTSDPTNYSITKPKQFFTPYLNGDPVVRAIDISNITQTSATITCKIYSGYNSSTTTYGVHLENGSGSYHSSNNYSDTDSTYTVNLIGLTVNTTYYLKAYATNDGGTTYSYGNGYNFTTLPISLPHVVITSISDIDKTSAKINCKVTDGGGTITDWGVKYSTHSNMADSTVISQPTISNNTFVGNPTGLSSHTTYYVRAFATNSAGTHTSPKVTFSTDYDKPTVTDLTISNTATPDGASDNATANFKVAAHSSEAADKVKTYGVCWSVLHNPTRSKSVVSDTDFAETTGSITSTTPEDCVRNMTQRFPNTKYYVRAYASTKEPVGGNLTDTVYSSETSFITLPAMVTKSASNVGTTSATLSGQIANRDSQGYLVNGYYGVCWGTSANPTRADGYYTERQITAANSSTFDFILDATTNISYATATTYHYRAYYKSSTGEIAYGLDETFNPSEHRVTVSANPAEGGTVSAYYNNNGTCTVTATANTGYSFTNWTESGTEVSTSASYEVSIGSTDHDLVANFTLNSYTVTVSANPTVGGTVTGDGSYNHGASCTVTATPNSGYTFSNWTDGSGNMVSEDASYTFTVTEAISLTANFDVSSKSSPSVPSTGTGTSGRPRDIYPAPAREPWDWDDDSFASFAVADTLPSAIDSLIQLREQLIRDAVVEPVDIPLIQSNKATRGGGIYMAKKASPSSPVAKLVFTGGADASHQGKIIFNYASEAGGGIYIDTTAMMQMKGHCVVNANHVDDGKDGGGIYLKGRLYVGNNKSDDPSIHGLIVNQNFALTAFDSTSYVQGPGGSGGSTAYTEANETSLNNVHLCRHTYSYAHAAAGGFANDEESTVITLLSDLAGNGSKAASSSSIGFHVSQGFCPVIATALSFGGDYVQATNGAGTSTDEYKNEEWLNHVMQNAVSSTTGLFEGDGVIFEDTKSYVAIHTRTPGAPFHSKYIYLWGCWTHPAVKFDPKTNNPMAGEGSGGAWLHHYKITNPEDNAANPSFVPVNNKPLKWEIYSEEGLAWFSAYVNGLNVFKDGDDKHHKYVAEKNSKAEVVLMADLDLSAHFWVPIGSVTTFQDTGISGGNIESLFVDKPDDPHHFKGKFDGEGHTIKGIDCRYLSGVYKMGLFGYLDDAAVVKNVFLDDSQFEASDNTKGFHIGGIAGMMSNTAVLSATEARSKIDITNAKKSSSYVGGLVGQVNGTANVIHSSMAMPEIKGSAKYVGGLVGELAAGNKLLNSFSNSIYPDAAYNDTCNNGDGSLNSYVYIGGLVGVNSGIVENCYSRLRGTEPKSNVTTSPNYNNSIFGWLAGSNTVAATENVEGGIRFSYIPSEKSVYVKNTTSGYNENPYGHGTYDATELLYGEYAFAHKDQQVTATNDYVTNGVMAYDNSNQKVVFKGLLATLNAWVDAKNTSTKTYHPWMRTMASTINDDLPILDFKQEGSSTPPTPPALISTSLFNVVGSKDGVYMDYKLDANELLTEYAALTSGTPDLYLYDANTEANGTTLKDITVTNVGTSPKVKLRINENVGIKQTVELEATVGVTFDNSSNTSIWGANYDWHMFSPAVKNVPMGITYRSSVANAAPGNVNYGIYANYSSLTASGIAEDDYASRDYMDPPVIEWNTAEGSRGYFPTNTPYGKWGASGHSPNSTENPDLLFNQGSFDLYAYGEAYYHHWINFKREGDGTFYDHWREDPDEAGMHHNIRYKNETTMVNGKGYMMAVSYPTMLMATGTLNNGNVTYNATYTVNPMATVYDEMVRGTNLIGNPYQSYLDADAFFAANSVVGNCYYILDADYTKTNNQNYTCYPNGSSTNPEYASQYIHPHQGFFVKVAPNPTPITFTNDMRVAGTNTILTSNFRGGRLDYPLVNLMCFDSDGKRDLTTVEMNRPELGGGLKMKRLHSGRALLYARFEDEDYQALFAPMGTTTVPVRFEASEDDVFTMKWSMYNGNFHYVHLIDNLTGADIDLLTAEEYKFQGSTEDYISRFRLVFEATGIDEDSDDDDTINSDSFAFQLGEELIVNGEGSLQMFDLNGRCLLSTRAIGGQSNIALPKVAAGVYMLRLTGDKQSKIQKIIIK